MTAPLVHTLILRFEQLNSEPPSPPDRTGGKVAYRIDGMPVCAVHAHELRQFLAPTRKLRRVLSVDDIYNLVVEFGLDYDDLRALHGPRLGEQCALCPTMHVEGNLCGSCDQPLHPKWPAVYCSNECALNDLST